jgi:uncharacterized protein (UPF0264 family)
MEKKGGYRKMKVLVSPKDVEEAKAVISGNADIVDVKNPKEGSLGANFPWVIKTIKQLVEEKGNANECSNRRFRL